ncbi:dihydroxy-acid dehydratase [Aureimonas altamirensis]|uniref:dihydroxy-acid dehydratase n=1 Tax=Aureimonas altamirensis TaxID=370622 RepID=UPI0020374849|nr:dihydroxy-acid dehydratase [Aureimonas altamirensis]MCM2505570.1 dihydroxy-acid dehydratase [Aureimonas altamirensis]
MSDGEETARGMARGLTNYGDRDFARYLRRSFALSMGYSREALDRPVVGINSTPSGFNNCHRTMPELVEAVRRGAMMAGALPVEFPTISLGEPYLTPTSLKFRNLMSMDVEEMVRAQPMDSVVLIGGCDKTVPAQIMGALSTDRPAVMLVTGPMMTGRYKGERLGACTDCRRYWARFRAGEVDGDEIGRVESNLATTAGTCAVMGTASTMACLAEVLGFGLAGSATAPAVHADRLRIAEDTGRIAAWLATDPKAVRPTELVTERSLDNAMRILLALSGSTNALVHLAAIAGRAGIRLSLRRLNELAETTPVLVNLKPVGSNYMEDLHAAGGMPALMWELRHLLDLDCRTVTGDRLGDRLDGFDPGTIDHSVIRRFDEPIEPKGGLIALFGNLAPDGAILKRAAATPELLEKEARAVVFSSLEDLAARVDDPSLDVRADDALVLRNAGPTSPAAMPEAGYLPIPRKLAAAGVKDMIRISDARMSGTAFGAIVLHVSPDAASGGPLALVRDGDRIRLSASGNRIELLVDEAELVRRRADLPPPLPPAQRGYAALYDRHVTQAPSGCDFDFLQHPKAR